MSEMVRFDFLGRRVLVTGGSRGIGHGIARAFADAGAQVIITGRKASPTEYDADLSDFEYRQLEMTDRAALDSLAEEVSELDVLVNNAGGSFPGGRDEWEPDVFEEAVATHLSSGFRLAVGLKDKIARSRIEGGGSVLNMASMSAYFAVTVVPGYGAGKAAVVQMTKNLAVAWARDNVRVNAVAPGLILTDMTAVMKGVEELEGKEIGRTPMARWGTPEDVAPAALFLASPAARFITGQTLKIDGGYSVA